MAKPNLILLFLIGIASCASPQHTQQTAITEKIEKTIKLPTGAFSISEYGRNYAFSRPDIVTGVYLVPTPPQNMGDGCEVISGNFSSRQCSESEVADITDMEEELIAREALAGESRWFKAVAELPQILDGGCSQVTFEYDVRLERIIKIECNGEA